MEGRVQRQGGWGVERNKVLETTEGGREPQAGWWKEMQGSVPARWSLQKQAVERLAVGDLQALALVCVRDRLKLSET